MKEGRYVFVSVLYVGFDAGEHSRGGDGSVKTSCKGYKFLVGIPHGKVDEESGGVGFCTEVFGRDMDERGRGPCGGFGGGHVGISQRGL